MIKQTCPICKGEFTHLFALSRKDNKTKICDDCGQQEALQAWSKAMKRKGRKVM